MSTTALSRVNAIGDVGFVTGGATMRKHRSLVVAVALALMALGGAVAVPRALAQPQRRAPDESPCWPDAHQAVAPAVLLTGESVTATITTTILCAAEVWPSVIVIILDGSSSMQGAPLDRAVSAAEAFVDWLDLVNRPYLMVGVVGFGDTGGYTCHARNDDSGLRRCIRRVRSVGPGQPVHDLGLALARGVMDPAYPDDANRFAVVFSDGGAPTDCGAAKRAADRLRGSGARVIAGCASAGCDTACLRAVAGNGADFVPWTRLPRAWLARLGQHEFSQIILVKPRQVTITGTIPAGVALLPGRVQPPPNKVSPDGRTLEWHFDQPDLVSQRVTVTLGLRPLGPGDQAVGLHAYGTLLDTKLRPKQFLIPDAWAAVLGRP
jgi:hypothetical protein